MIFSVFRGDSDESPQLRYSLRERRTRRQQGHPSGNFDTTPTKTFPGRSQASPSKYRENSRLYPALHQRVAWQCRGPFLRIIGSTVASGAFSRHSPGMIEFHAETVKDTLIRLGRLWPTDEVAVETLAGGVSNVVLLISPRDGMPFVLKQSRERLRTEADWFSRLDRVYREAEAQRALSKLLPPGAVPNVLWEDRENYCFAMEAIRPDHAVWKRQLLSGQVDRGTFVRAGELLGEMHSQTAGRPDLIIDANEDGVFFELRVDPFYRRIAAVYPSIHGAVHGLIGEMDRSRMCLVHADFSPKNLLVHPDGMSLVDYETVHYGDPAFDLGFFFSHLWLKAVALTAARPQMIAGIEAAWDAYRQTLTASTLPGDSLSTRAVPHLAACLLARIDGKSPVDYLREDAHRAFVRDQALGWLQRPPENIDQAFQRLSTATTTLM